MKLSTIACKSRCSILRNNRLFSLNLVNPLFIKTIRFRVLIRFILKKKLIPKPDPTQPLRMYVRTYISYTTNYYTYENNNVSHLPVTYISCVYHSLYFLFYQKKNTRALQRDLFYISVSDFSRIGMDVSYYNPYIYFGPNFFLFFRTKVVLEGSDCGL